MAGREKAGWLAKYENALSPLSSPLPTRETVWGPSRSCRCYRCGALTPTGPSPTRSNTTLIVSPQVHPHFTPSLPQNAHSEAKFLEDIVTDAWARKKYHLWAERKTDNATPYEPPKKCHARSDTNTRASSLFNPKSISYSKEPDDFVLKSVSLADVPYRCMPLLVFFLGLFLLFVLL